MFVKSLISYYAILLSNDAPARYASIKRGNEKQSQPRRDHATFIDTLIDNNGPENGFNCNRFAYFVLTGLANFGVGSYIEATQRTQAALGAAAAYLNFYGLEGIGLRQPFGALPGPGALAALAKVGPLGMPGPVGLNAAFIPDQLQGIAETFGPLIAPAAIGSNVLGAAGGGAAAGLGGALMGDLGLGGSGLADGLGLGGSGLAGGLGLGGTGLGGASLGAGGFGGLGMGNGHSFAGAGLGSLGSTGLGLGLGHGGGAAMLGLEHGTMNPSSNVVSSTTTVPVNSGVISGTSTSVPSTTVIYTTGKGNLPATVINNFANVASTGANVAGSVTAAAIKGVGDIAASKVEAAGNIVGMAIHNAGYKANKIVNKVQNIHAHKKEIIGGAINDFGHLMQTGGQVLGAAGGQGGVNMNMNSYYLSPSNTNQVVAAGGSGSAVQQQGVQNVAGVQGATLATQGGAVGTVGTTTAVPGQQTTGGASGVVAGNVNIGTTNVGTTNVGTTNIGSANLGTTNMGTTNMGTATMTSGTSINNSGSNMGTSSMTTNGNMIVSGNSIPAGSMQQMVGSPVIVSPKPKSFVSGSVVAAGSSFGGGVDVAVKGPFKTVEGAAKAGKIWG
eukprot:gene11443-11589_t